MIRDDYCLSGFVKARLSQMKAESDHCYSHDNYDVDLLLNELILPLF